MDGLWRDWAECLQQEATPFQVFDAGWPREPERRYVAGRLQLKRMVAEPLEVGLAQVPLQLAGQSTMRWEEKMGMPPSWEASEDYVRLSAE